MKNRPQSQVPPAKFPPEVLTEEPPHPDRHSARAATATGQRKVRCDAMLQNLPPARQEEIIEWCETPKSEGCIGGIAYARERLAAEGIEVWPTSLRRFRIWFYLQEELEAARDCLESCEVTEETLAYTRRCAQQLFLELAIARRDVKLFQAATRAADRQQQIEQRAERDRTRAKQEEARQEQRRERDRAEAEHRKQLQLLARERLEELKQRNKPKEPEFPVRKKGGLSAETIREIQKAAKLL